MNLLIKLLLTVLLLFNAAANLFAQEFELQDHWWQPNGVVRSMAIQGDTLYVGGEFNYISRHRAIGGGPVDTIKGRSKHPLLLSGGGSEIFTSLADGEGGWYIGGNFTKVGDSLRNYVAQIDSNGYVTAWNPDCNAQVRTILEKNGLLYLGGAFSTVGGLPRTCLAAIDKHTGMPTSLSITITGSHTTSIYALAFLNDTLYFGGSFRSVDNINKANLASINVITGLATAWNPWNAHMNASKDGSVNSLIIDSIANVIYIAGEFDDILYPLLGGYIVRHFARLSLSTGLSTWQLRPSNRIYSMAMDQHNIYLGGSSGTGSGALSLSGLMVINKNSGQSVSWSPQLNHPGGGRIHAISVHNNKLYLGGMFSFANDTVQRHSIASFNTQTGLITDWSPDAQGYVFTISHNAESVFLGGAISAMGGVIRQNVAAFNVTTGVPTDFSTSIDFRVDRMALDGAMLYVGGRMYYGMITNNLAGLNRYSGIINWTHNLTTSPSNSGLINALKVSGGKLFVGGTFAQTNGQPRNNLAAFNKNTGVLLPWSPNADASVTCLDNVGPSILLGGDFINIGNQQRMKLAMVDSITGQLTGWNFGFPSSSSVRAVCIRDTTLYVTGSFANADLSYRNNFAAFSLNSGALTPWNPMSNYSSSIVFVDSGVAYLGGSFSSVGGQSRNFFAMTDIVTGNVLPWTTRLNRFLTALLKDQNSLYMGGMFDTVDNRYKKNMVVFSKPATKIDSIQVVQHCAGDSIQINYQLLETFGIGNVFTAQLSNPFGNFEYPITLGSITSNQSGTINLKLPVSLAYGEGYRIRLVSSNPVRIGSSNPNDIRVNNNIRVNDSITACFQHINPLGIVRYSSGFYTDSLQSVFGCDSIVSFYLNIKPRMDTAVIVSNVSLQANALNVSYQWMDCLAGAIIPGATFRAYVPLTSSAYAVLLTANGCTDTSACIPFNMVSIDELEKTIQLFPNPNNGAFIVDFGQIYPEVNIDIQDLYGRNVYQATVQNSSSERISFKQPAGLYFINLRFGDKVVIKKLVLKE